MVRGQWTVKDTAFLMWVISLTIAQDYLRLTKKDFETKNIKCAEKV